LDIWEFIGFAGFIFVGLGFLFYMKGDRIQSVVNEKTRVTDVRAATMVDLVYAIILFYFKMVNNIPMSTTWVFIGLLGGREIAIALAKSKKLEKRRINLMQALYLTRKDFTKAFIGLIVSLIMALIINEGVRNEVMDYFR
jgi:phosphate/sulfate permease